MVHAHDNLLAALAHHPSSGWVLISGASSYIAKAVIEQLLDETDVSVIAVSRHFSSSDIALSEVEQRLILLESDYCEAQIGSIATQLKSVNQPCHGVFIFNGILQQKNIKPEKHLGMFDSTDFITQIGINTLIPMLWVKHLVKALKSTERCPFVVLSARVGSIEDNQLGGWYSYRASKAALNMLIKTASIEYARTNKGVKFIAFHPGTTDTPLSKPFQNNVPKEKLFTPNFVAQQLLAITQNVTFDGAAAYLDWQGKPIKW